MSPNNYQYKFDNFVLIPKQRLLLQNNEIAPLSIRAFNVLLIMVKREGRIVQKQEFMDNVWADTFVEEGNLPVAINSLRKILHSKIDGKTYIETFPRRGYRFTAKVEIEPFEEAPIEIAAQTVSFGKTAESARLMKIEANNIKPSKIRSLSMFFAKLKLRK